MTTEPLGWNYDHFDPNGRNIHFLRDTNHEDESLEYAAGLKK